jgi:hypothetical protein
MHIRDIRAEMARLGSKVKAVELRLAESPSGDMPAHLHDAIADAYNLAELRLLAAGLGLNHEELNGEGLTDTALSLVMWSRRHGRLPALLAALREQRPHVCWDYT